VIGEPPSSDGAAHERVTTPCAALSARLRGALGLAPVPLGTTRFEKGWFPVPAPVVAQPTVSHGLGVGHAIALRLAPVVVRPWKPGTGAIAGGDQCPPASV